MKCPYCVTEVTPKLKTSDNRTFYHCTTCSREIHRDLVEDQKTPQTSVGLIGYTGHGKTVYVTSLFYVLKHFQSSWPGYHYLCLDSEANAMVYERVRHFEENAVLPPGTPINFPHPHLISYCRIPHFRDVRLTYYDVGGQVYESPSGISQQGSFVAHADTVFFLVSVAEFGSSWTTDIQKRLDIYVNAVRDMGLDIKTRQNLVLVLTKADLLIADMPDELKRYLTGGDLTRYVNLKAALAELKTSSRQIRQWLMDRMAGGFVNLAEKSFKRVEYCIVSATGSAPVQGRLTSKLNPRDPKRVLDPLLWALIFRTPSRGAKWGRLAIAAAVLLAMATTVKKEWPVAATAIPKLFHHMRR